MTRETFTAALRLSMELEGPARRLGYKMIMLSGGECTEHPDILDLIQQAMDTDSTVILVSNGSWLGTPLQAQILRPEWRDKLRVQVTNDPSFYPKPIKKVDDPRIVYVDKLTILQQLGRFTGKSPPEGYRAPLAPSSFNLRSLTRQTGSLVAAITYLRQRAMTGVSGNCTPSISANGDFVVGETQKCYAIGTVHDSVAALNQAALAMPSCDRCGLESKLDPMHRAAIGLGPKTQPVVR